MEQQIEQLKRIETECAMAVCSVHGVITKNMIDRLDALRSATGMTYDAVNGKLSPLNA